MLYHVPHRLAALHELRRVVRSGGRVVLATNGSNYLACLAGLHREAALALGYTPSDGDSNRFTLDDLKLVQHVFPSAERYVLSNALVFRESEPIVRYHASGMVDRLAGGPSDASHRPRLIAQPN